jgi:SET domain-containing protein
MSRYRLRIAASPIHHIGAFAAEMIPAGRKVIEYTGKRLDRRGLRALIQKVGNLRAVRLRYVFEYHRNCFVDGAVGGSRAEVINHSCDPNLAGRKISGHILYFSRRQIQAGEELTVDYRYAPTALQSVTLEAISQRENSNGTKENEENHQGPEEGEEA